MTNLLLYSLVEIKNTNLELEFSWLLNNIFINEAAKTMLTSGRIHNYQVTIVLVS